MCHYHKLQVILFCFSWSITKDVFEFNAVANCALFIRPSNVAHEMDIQFFFCNFLHKRMQKIDKNQLCSKWHPIQHWLMNIERWALNVINDDGQWLCWNNILSIFLWNHFISQFQKLLICYALCNRSAYGGQCSVVRCCSFVSNKIIIELTIGRQWWTELKISIILCAMNIKFW